MLMTPRGKIQCQSTLRFPPWKLAPLLIQPLILTLSPFFRIPVRSRSRHPASMPRLVQKFRKGEAFGGPSRGVQFVRFGGSGMAESVAFVGLGWRPS